jgi:hypothetical protein
MMPNTTATSVVTISRVQRLKRLNKRRYASVDTNVRYAFAPNGALARINPHIKSVAGSGTAARLVTTRLNV